MTISEKFILGGALVFVLAAGCSDDDADLGDGGTDGGDAATSGGGRAGRGGGSAAGRGGSGGRGSQAGAGSSAEEDGGETDPGTSGAGGAGADGGVSGAGAGGMDAAVTDAGEDPTPPAPGCDGLMECCAELSPPERMNCELIATNADDLSCDQLQPLVCPPDEVDDEACMMLNECCETLPLGPLRVSCATTVMAGMPLQCQQVTAAFCPEGGDPNACATLASCCESLPPPQRANCNMIVQLGMAPTCEVIEPVLCP